MKKNEFLDALNLDVMIEEVDRNINKGLVIFKLLSDVIDIHIIFNPELNKIQIRIVINRLPINDSKQAI